MKIFLYNQNLEDPSFFKSQILKLDSEYIEQPWSTQMWNEILSESKYLIYLLENEGELVGYALYNFASNEFAHLLKAVITPQFRGQGHASSILSHSIEQFKLQEMEYIYLEVAVDNDPAIKLYEKLGFEQIALKKKFYSNGQDAYAMHLKLE